MSRDLRNYFRRNVKPTESVSVASTYDHRFCKEQRQEQDHALPTSKVANIDSQKRRSRHRRSEMWTVSEDDALIQRAANPRTGVISPFITGCGDEQCVASDYLAVGKEKAKPSPLIRIARKAVGSGTRSRMHEPINSAVPDADAAVKPPVYKTESVSSTSRIPSSIAFRQHGTIVPPPGASSPTQSTESATRRTCQAYCLHHAT